MFIFGYHSLMQKGTQFVLVTAFIPWKDKVLLAKRSTTDDFLPGYWEQFGGNVDFGENLYDAVVREVQEEAGITVTPHHPYFVFDEITASGRQAIEVAFYCKPQGMPEITLSHEHDDFTWVREDEFIKVAPVSELMTQVILEGFKVHHG